jgi:polyisoprenoid-binding protein YceI
MKLRSPYLAPAILALAFAVTASAAVETYVIDPVHSSVAFTARHVFSKVAGSFTTFNGTLTIDRANLEKSSVEAVIDVGSVTTASEKRDAHLKTPDFFDAAKFASITFKSKAWKKTGEDTFDVTGDLTMHGVTKEVVLKTKLLGFGDGLQGAYVSGWEASTTLNRLDYGINGPAWLGKAVGDDIPITISIEADLKK